jgi:hypothetical protein
MPRGVPKKGFRLTRKRLGLASNVCIESRNPEFMPASSPVQVIQRPPETVEQIEKKLSERFEALETMARATAEGINRAFIVSGPAGLGKSFTVESVVNEMEKKGRSVTYIKGYMRPIELYRILYNARKHKSIVVFDDSDSLFYDAESMNMLKHACDSTDKRKIGWYSSSIDRIVDDDGDAIPEQFEFNGSIIFITNYDFDNLIATGSRLTPHFEALVSRSMYLDLEMKTKMDYIVRIRQVVGYGMLAQRGFSKSEQDTILDFIEQHKDELRELSLRVVIKISTLLRMDANNWQKLARQTCFRVGK